MREALGILQREVGTLMMGDLGSKMGMNSEINSVMDHSTSIK